MKQKTYHLSISLGFAVTLSTSFAFAGLLFSSSRLALKDLDQMNKLVQEKVKESRKSGGDKSIPLKEALQAVYSRPNDDGMIEKVSSPLREELENQKAWERSIRALVKEATGALKNNKAFKVEAQITYLVFLENVLSEFKPKLDHEFEKSVVEQIRDAHIEVSTSAKRERDLRMLKQAESPSKVAEVLLTPVKATK